MGGNKKSKRSRIDHPVPGPKTREILGGIVGEYLELLETGEAGWDVWPPSGHGVGGTEEAAREQAIAMMTRRDHTVVLTDLATGGQQFFERVPRETAGRLIETWDFERRQLDDESTRPRTFAQGNLEDWVGIRPDADWHDLVAAYRGAISILGEQLARDEVTAPYLFLCRHTLELQLKAVIVKGQEAMGLELDLPGHHSLLRLWTAAYPIAAYYDKDSSGKQLIDLSLVLNIVREFHDADPDSFHFRYPVRKDNKPVAHQPFVHAFSKADQAELFSRAADELDRLIQLLVWQIFFATI